ncbi:uncharacterized protein LOC124896861 [Capsicum annuum]|uniref:uncharacterized protein LOC124896861 n=1 Tax=Capsicum annuum TaxID=4072 RepID=UPI001FB19912|nr:uncharacterized protein LOC124896861 [Capsicum annuum]
MTSPNIYKDIISACAKETVKEIIEDLNGDYFGILVDESKDVSHKEQMTLVLRYVNKDGKLIERYLDLVYVKDTSAKSLKEAIYSLLLDHSLRRFQMQGQAVAKKHDDVNNFVDILANVLNIVGGSFKHREMLRDDQAKKLEELLLLSKVHMGSGLNQELELQRPDDTHWGSHFKTVRNFISLFLSIVHVLGVLEKEGANYHEKTLAKSLVENIRSYEFIYMLHLMLKILVVTYDLNMALQRKDQDIVNAIKLVDFLKRQFQLIRECKWNSLLEDVSLFCEKNDIVILEMNEKYELNNRFSEVNTDLLLGMASLSPDNYFSNYDKDKIMKLATYYPNEFSASYLEDLSFDLDNYIYYVREVDNSFSNLKELGDLSIKLVETNMHKTWRLVYLLAKLSLILSVATATGDLRVQMQRRYATCGRKCSAKAIGICKTSPAGTGPAQTGCRDVTSTE